MGIADKFRDLSQRLPTAINDPMFQLGIQLMQAGGYQPGDVTTGQRLGHAVQGFGQQQAQAQQLQQMQLLNQHRQQQMDQQRAEAQSAAQLAERMRDPAFLESLPEHSRRLAAAGASPEQVYKIYELESRLGAQQQQMQQLEQYRQGQLGIQRDRADAYIGRQQQLGQGGGAPAGPRPPAQRQTVDQPIGNGMVQRLIYDQQSGGYVPFGEPFSQRAPAASADPLGPEIEPPTAQQEAEGASTISRLISGLPTGSKASPPVRQGADLLMYDAGQPAALAASGGGQQQAQQAKPGAQPQVAQPRSKAEYDALPSGTRYVDPGTGKVATKR